MEELRYALMGNGRQCAVVDGQKINKQFVEVLKLMTCYTVRFFVFSYNIILMIVPRVCHFRGDSTGTWTNHQGTLLLH